MDSIGALCSNGLLEGVGECRRAQESAGERRRVQESVGESRRV